MSEERWVFGYGSLIWRPSFGYAQRRPARVRGFARRFWQGSTDHRGVPGAPGRVVTLSEQPAEECFGVAYRLEPGDAERVLEALDHRERGGYARLDLGLEFDDGATANALLWVATQQNPNYLGPAPLAEIAAQVRRSHGPSGSNLEYVLRLAGALRAMQANDDHVFALEALLREAPLRPS